MRASCDLHYWYKKSLHLLLLGAMWLPTFVFAQSETNDTRQYTEQERQVRSFDRDQWNNTIRNIRYDSDVRDKKETYQRDQERKGEADRARQNEEPASWEINFPPIIGKILLFLIGGVAVFFLIKTLLGLENPRNRKIKTEEEALALAVEKAEENIEQADTRSLLQKAIDQKAYNLAIRLYFLSVLKELSQQKIINWKKDKTNRDYQRELYNSPFLHDFRQLCLIFDHSWYGQRNITASVFQQLEPEFKSFLSQINTTQKQAS
ncbi:MAG: hypothetical protein MRY78_00525 [Saprospiraceae bacterium]|nr:hypothetical protein [Saprospiraceae bacterium]